VGLCLFGFPFSDRSARIGLRTDVFMLNTWEVEVTSSARFLHNVHCRSYRDPTVHTLAHKVNRDTVDIIRESADFINPVLLRADVETTPKLTDEQLSDTPGQFTVVRAEFIITDNGIPTVRALNNLPRNVRDRHVDSVNTGSVTRTGSMPHSAHVRTGHE
jgi:hypothetical protein